MSRALPTIRKTRVLEGTDARSLPIADLIADGRPAILRGIANKLPLVALGMKDAQQAISCLKQHDGGLPVTAYVGEATIRGRFGYQEDCSALNFQRETGSLSGYLDQLSARLSDVSAGSIYIGSTDIDRYLPGIRESAVLPFDIHQMGDRPPLTSIWIGNRTTASAHYDMSNNIAVTLVGRRRFTLFPPDQITNLYPGPIDLTPAGQVVSLVDFGAPDLERYPRFALALAEAEIAEMEPGDALIYPALWWHQVEALDNLNVMINYWWNTSHDFIDTPQTTLLHALISLRDRPNHEKQAWKSIFDYYIFGEQDRVISHIPEPGRGNLATLDQTMARHLRAQIIKKLNR